MLFTAVKNNKRVWESKEGSLGIMEMWGTLKKSLPLWFPRHKYQ